MKRLQEGKVKEKGEEGRGQKEKERNERTGRKQNEEELVGCEGLKVEMGDGKR